MQNAGIALPGLGAMPLSPEELDRRAISELVRLHGFVTGIAVTPRRLAQDLWLKEIMPEKSTEPLAAMKRETMRLFILQMFGKVVNELNAREPSFLPAFEPGDVKEARNWARGFVDAMAVCPEVWDRLDATSEVKIKTIPIRLLDVEDEEAKAEMVEVAGRSFEELEQSAIAAIEASVLALNRHAKKVRGPLQLHDAAPGRNDPCSCGSGKKYKKCCGR